MPPRVAEERRGALRVLPPRSSNHMPSELDLVSLARQVEGVQQDNSHRWALAHAAGSLRVYATLTPGSSADVYCIRLDFGESLAAGPPSVVFCNPVSHAEGVLADWPGGMTDYFKTPPNNTPTGWICNPWTREGRAHHPEWSYGWRPNRAIWSVLTAIQDILDKPHAYSGRAA
jgi:ubiquitin-protein ligase